MYQRGMDGINTEGLGGFFDTIQKVARGVIEGSDAAKQIAAGTYTPYPGSTPVLYAGPSAPSPQPASSGVPTTLLLGSVAVLGVVLFMLRRGRR